MINSRTLFDVDKFFFAAGAAPEETNQRSSSAHNRHSLTKGKFNIECNELHLGHSRLLKACGNIQRSIIFRRVEKVTTVSRNGNGNIYFANRMIYYF